MSDTRNFIIVLHYITGLLHENTTYCATIYFVYCFQFSFVHTSVEYDEFYVQ